MLSSKSIGSVHGGAREPGAYRKTQASHLVVESILGTRNPSTPEAAPAAARPLRMDGVSRDRYRGVA
jgi:hypothetical protein